MGKDSLELQFQKADMVKWQHEDATEEIESGQDNALDAIEPAKRNMTIFFLIDTSSSMSGTKLGTVNGTMEELIPDLIGIGGSEAEISIAVLQYATDVKWITEKGPISVNQFEKWTRLSAEGVTSMGAAFEELNKKLSRSAFMSKPSLSYAPVIFLMTDGEPNDDWKSGLDSLKRNKWFHYALKIAVGIGSMPNMDVLREFTGKTELAIKAHDSKELKGLIQFLTIKSSEIGSKSMTLVDENHELTEEDVRGSKEKELVEAIHENKDIMGDISVNEDAVDYEQGW